MSLGGVGPGPSDPWVELDREPGSVRVYLVGFVNELPGSGRCPGGYAGCGGGCEIC